VIAPAFPGHRESCAVLFSFESAALQSTAVVFAYTTALDYPQAECGVWWRPILESYGATRCYPLEFGSTRK
jgi:hypothetical protein